MQHFDAPSTNLAATGLHPWPAVRQGIRKIGPSPRGLLRDHNPMPAEVVKKGVPILMNKSLPGSGVLPEATIRSVEAGNAVPF
jgi:hypothetical protein